MNGLKHSAWVGRDGLLRRNLAGCVLAVGCVAALAAGLIVGAPAHAQTAETGAAASANAAATAAAEATGVPATDTAAPSAPAGPDIPQGPSHGLAPLPDGEMVPLNLMPPGTNASPIPSEKIFPPQTITIRFNHRLHVKKFKQTCKVCHSNAYQSTDALDRLIPDPRSTCDNCHDVDHSNLQAVEAGDEPNGQCTWCHIGDDAGVDGRVAKMVFPQANLRMSHKAHLDRNIDCAQCHGQIEELELATRDNLPRMAGCFSCHAQSGAAQGEAKGHCTNCHLAEPSGRLITTFSEGDLQPPSWLHGAGHTPDWLQRHKGVAGANSELCSQCHSETWCNACHDGKVRDRQVHPNDWISMHPQAARQDNPRCVSCHQLQTFCADCHRRVGVARDTGSANRLAGRRFHPDPRTWTTGPRSPQHHGWEAQRNLNACVACHTERDCTTCHASKGLRGGAGINPHPLGFIDKCGRAQSRNPRPCLVCHEPSDPVLTQCQ